MSPRPVLSLLTALSLATLAGGCRTLSSPGPVPSPEDVVRAQQEAWNSGDLTGFAAAGYWQSPDLCFFSGGTKSLGYEDLLARFRRRYTEGGAQMGTLDFDGLETLELGSDDRLVRGRWRLVFPKGDSTGGLFTLVMHRFDEGWRITHDHTSVED